MAIEIPSRGLLDYLSRVDDLLVIVVRLLERLSLNTVQGAVTITTPERYEIPVAKVKRLATSSTVYVTLVTWELPTDRMGELSFVEMDSDNFASTRFKLEGAGKILFEDFQLSSALSLEFPVVRLAPGSAVVLSMKSIGGEVVAYGDIVGKEIPRW